MSKIRYSIFDGDNHSAIKNFISHCSRMPPSPVLSECFAEYSAELTYLSGSIGFEVEFKDPKMYTLFLMEWS